MSNDEYPRYRILHDYSAKSIYSPMLKIEIDDLKMLGLKYVAGAFPGKSLKTFNEKWKQTYDRLMYGSDKNIMQCYVCLNH